MKYLLLIFMLFSLSATAQINEKELKENMAKLDSQTAALNASMNESMRVMDSINTARSIEQMGRNMTSFLAERKAQEKKNMQRMYWRLGFGILMLIVLIVGWTRKKKTAAVK